MTYQIDDYDDPKSLNPEFYESACDECGSTGRCHPNCSFHREQDRSDE